MLQFFKLAAPGGQGFAACSKLPQSPLDPRVQSRSSKSSTRSLTKIALLRLLAFYDIISRAMQTSRISPAPSPRLPVHWTTWTLPRREPPTSRERDSNKKERESVDWQRLASSAHCVISRLSMHVSHAMQAYRAQWCTDAGVHPRVRPPRTRGGDR